MPIFRACSKTNLKFGIGAHFLPVESTGKKPGFPLQVLGFAYANPVGFPLQSLAQQLRTSSRNCHRQFRGSELPLVIRCA
jgi:hypothetical protein